MTTVVDGDHGERSNDKVAVRVDGLVKRFKRSNGSYVNAVNGVSLEIGRGEMVVILGPSGCGKTTLLRCIAGLEDPTDGRIESSSTALSAGGRVLVPAEKRGFGMMFQSYAVWPHKSVYGNVAYGPEIRRQPKAEIKRQVDRILGMVGIAHLAREYPAQLSGGQQQRVALARSLVIEPEVVLFDEPLSNVDAKVREELRGELLAMQKRMGFAGIYVTHDQDEAMAIADHVVVMSNGEIVQEGPPKDVYTYPNSQFVANFVGSANEWTGQVGTSDTSSGTTGITTTTGTVDVATRNLPAGVAEGDSVAVIVRPEVAVLTAGTQVGTAMNAWSGTISRVTFRGGQSDFVVQVGDSSITARLGSTVQVGQPGDNVVVAIDPADMHVIRVAEPALEMKG